MQSNAGLFSQAQLCIVVKTACGGQRQHPSAFAKYYIHEGQKGEKISMDINPCVYEKRDTIILHKYYS